MLKNADVRLGEAVSHISLGQKSEGKLRMKTSIDELLPVFIG